MAILLPYALCTPADVQTYLVGSAQPGQQAEQIIPLINAFTVAAQAYCNRKFAAASYVEYFTVDPDRQALLGISDARLRRWPFQSSVRVKAPPIGLVGNDPLTPDVTVWNDVERLYPEKTKLALYDRFMVDPATGVVSPAMWASWASGYMALKVRYSGGFVKAPAEPNDSPGFTVPAEDLRMAAVQQVALVFQRRKEAGADTVSFPAGGSVSMTSGDPTKWLSSVRRALDRWKIFSVR